jgi:hypothetical protein
MVRSCESGVSSHEARISSGASSFETRSFAALLRMRVEINRYQYGWRSIQ